MWWGCCLFVSMLDGSGHFDGCFGSVMAVYVVGLLSVCLYVGWQWTL